jgi:geranylgeranyl diphosphate synthase type II
MTDVPWKRLLPTLERELRNTWDAFSPGGSAAEAAAYSLFAGGKRLRPILVVLSHGACGGGMEPAAIQVGLAVEMIHTYSLLHDDLPALDDDAYRRGRPTCHRIYGTETALMAGDLLQVAAFWTVARALEGDSALLRRVAEELSRAAGGGGMVAGQVADLAAEGASPSPRLVEFIHQNKTAALLRCCCRIGALVAEAEPGSLEAMTVYGERLGLAFQVVDDILDLEGDRDRIGKEPGSDLRRRKMTYPRVYGLETSRERARELIDEACEALRPVGERRRELESLARYVISREA